MINVTAAILIKDNKILIAKRRPADRLANMWEFPGGKLEDGETPEECLKREIFEELGIDIIVHQHVGNSEYHYDHISINLMAYRVEWINGAIEPTSHAEIVFISPDEIGNYIFAPADLPFVEMIKNRKIHV